MADAVGSMRERLLVQQNVWPALAVTSLTRVGTTATAVTDLPHGYLTGDYVQMAGASPAGYDGKVKVTVVDPVTFTYPVDGSLASPATATITAQYASDPQGGRRANWTALDTVWAEMVPLTAGERLQLGTTQAIVTYQFRVRVRTDLSPKMRVQWTPRWPPNAPTQALEVNGVRPWTDPWSGGMRYQVLQCAEVAA